MPRNGTGTFSLARSPFTPGTVISSADVNATLSDLAAGLTNSVASNGETTITGQLRGLPSASPAWSFSGDTDTGFGSPGPDQAYIKCAGSQVAYFHPGGVVLGGIVQGAIPVGMVVSFAGAAAPGGWLLCHGQDISRATYAALFAALGSGSIYGAIDGSSFRLPDCRGRVVAGLDSGTGRLIAHLGDGMNGSHLGAVGGTYYHYNTQAEMANHAHNIATFNTVDGVGAHRHFGVVNQGADQLDVNTTNPMSYINGLGIGNFIYRLGWNSGQTEANTSPSSLAGAHNHNIPTHDTDSRGNGNITPFNIVQPTIALNKIIYAGA